MTSRPPETRDPWPADAVRVRPPRRVLIGRFALLSGLAVGAVIVVWVYRALADSPFHAVEMLPLPLGYLGFAFLCLNAYVVVKPADAWVMVWVMRRTLAGLFVAMLLTIALHQVSEAWLAPKLPWALGALYIALAGFLVLGGWWWARVRYEYTFHELMWVEGFWQPRRWAWKDFNRSDHGGEGRTAVAWLYSHAAEAVCVPLEWAGARDMLRHVRAREL